MLVDIKYRLTSQQEEATEETEELDAEKIKELTKFLLALSNAALVFLLLI